MGREKDENNGGVQCTLENRCERVSGTSWTGRKTTRMVLFIDLLNTTISILAVRVGGRSRQPRVCVPCPEVMAHLCQMTQE
jgi:hypothetical protein